ncbi:hypothetical protein [Actinomyces ruminis]|uniref:Peptidoglycan-binding protein LysM n=1 Tax=Actinomyces ruminis TaxID=1937003 RepID=A0ABX4MA83_9ACTO|nr:hypothetical protein [Actinomyces ruminis]PHP52378.1 peptidoglycan-binding protein LysM [Actinomyces ruminis]
MRDSVRLAGLGLACAAIMPVLLSATLGSVRTLFALPPAWWGANQLSAAITALGCAAGTVGALWHLVSAAVALVILYRSTRSGVITEFQEPNAGAAVRLLRRWGAPLVRRLAGGVLVVGVTASPALAATDSMPDTDDLGWRPTASAPARPSETESLEPEAVEAAAATAPATQTAVRIPLLPAAESPGAQLSTPHRAAGAAVASESPAMTGTTDTTTHRVAVGESLWSITAGSLGPDAATADIAAAWPRLYQANLEVIGATPGSSTPERF